MKLNIGCGFDYKKGYVNVDNLTECLGAKVDVNHDLDKFPYPFKNGSIKEIYCNHVIEHTKYPDKVFREFHRIMEKGGLLYLNVPYFTRGYSVHVHWHGFSIWSVLEDTKKMFKPVSVNLVWDDPESFKKMKIILKPFCKFWNWFLNRNHWFSERFLAYKFGGILEIRFVLEKK